MGPDSELYDKAKVWTFVKDPIVRGKVPLKLFDSKTRRNRLVNNPIVSGIVDAIRWFLKDNSARLGKLPMLEGKVPAEVACSETTIPITLA